MKKILIAVPTNKYVETDTMKAIYNLEVPEGYTTQLEFFFGYQVDQIRNLIADWAKGYDYLFSVDSDISFAPDTLKKLLAHNKDVVSGLYIQRIPNTHTLELYSERGNIPYGDIEGKGLVEIAGCGFGCVLINSNVIRAMEYPHFVYRSAIDHKHTLSEDVYFCMKARERGFRIFADTTILCNHHGSHVYTVQSQKKHEDPPPMDSVTQRLLDLSNTRLLPAQHVNYLHTMNSQGIKPKVIYDIGACVLHWTREAIGVWPQSTYIAIEAMDESKPIFEHFGVPYHTGVLSSEDNKIVTFYKNVTHPGGNSYYRENDEISPKAKELYTNSSQVTTMTLDTIVKMKGFPQPDLIKIDVQGAEYDVILGAKDTLANCKDVIVECQFVEYNKGAQLYQKVVELLGTMGFKLVGNGPFCYTNVDGDFHFTKVK